MRCPSFAELPPPPPNRIGWPWTEESARLPERSGEPPSWPRVTIVTPSFNQGRFIEQTIRSVLLQGYPDLEYVVLDGGSSDDTLRIIKKYSQWMDCWVSEPDGGQSAAINRGLQMGSGVYAAWINSDDMLCKNALTGLMFRGAAPTIVHVGDCVYIDEANNILCTHRGRVRSFEDLVRVPRVWRADGHIDQPAVLFPLELALRVGGLDENNHYTMDYHLWGKFFLAGAQVDYTGVPFGFFRRHHEQKTQGSLNQTESMLDVATALIAQADCLSAPVKQEVLAELRVYRLAYPDKVWRDSGRLARVGLPPSMVKRIRQLKRTVDETISDFTKL
jgi:hypothetical protein